MYRLLAGVLAGALAFALAGSAGAHSDIVIPREALLYRAPLLREIRFYWGLQEPPATFFAQVHQESAWRATARSRFAAGLAQFTPGTAAWMQGLYPKDFKDLCGNPEGCPLDSRWALRALVLFDKRLWDGFTFAETVIDRWGFTLSAYNGGAGWIVRERVAARSQGLSDTRWFNGVERVCLRADWACRENRHYAPTILFRWRPHYEQWLHR